MEETCQEVQCEKDIQSINQNDEDVSETVVQFSSDKEDSDLFACISDGEEVEL